MTGNYNQVLCLMCGATKILKKAHQSRKENKEDKEKNAQRSQQNK